MINPPFPYNVIICRAISNADPFSDAEEAVETVYEGVCDFENSRFPNYKNDVQVGKYKLYLPDNTLPVEIGDKIKLSMHNRVILGEIVDFFPTNFGLTVSWDSVKN
jgi:hypothetical protein